VTRKSMTAAEVERSLRKAAQRVGKGWTIREVRGQGGRKRGKEWMAT
jgi:hypothetical protein